MAVSTSLNFSKTVAQSPDREEDDEVVYQAEPGRSDDHCCGCTSRQGGGICDVGVGGL
jgi:hypothetical protein